MPSKFGGVAVEDQPQAGASRFGGVPIDAPATPPGLPQNDGKPMHVDNLPRALQPGPAMTPPQITIPSRAEFGKDPAGSISHVMRGVGTAVSPLAAIPLAGAPLATIGGAAAGYAGGRAARGAAKFFGASPGAQDLSEDVGGLAAAPFGSAAAESPAIRGGIRGAVSAIPGAIQDAAIPGAAAVFGRGSTLGHIAEGAAAIRAVPPLVRGGIAGAKGRDMMGPIARSMFPQPEPISRSPLWRGIEPSPVVTPGSSLGQNPMAESLDSASLPSGRQPGGIHNVPEDISRPERGAPLWRQYGAEPSPSKVANLTPIQGDLPSGRFPVSSRFPEPAKPSRIPIWRGANTDAQPRFAAPQETQVLSEPLTPPVKVESPGRFGEDPAAYRARIAASRSKFDANGRRIN